MGKKKSRGRPPKYVRNDKGRPVVGLSYDEPNNRYFNTHWKSEGTPKEHFGNDKEEAIFNFQQWESQRKGEDFHPIEKEKTKKSVKITISDDFLKKDNETEDGFKERITALNLKIRNGEYDIKTSPLITIPESFIFAKARELILRDIHEARKKMNLPIELKGTFKTEKSITLNEIGNLYFDERRKSVSKDYKREGKMHWGEFKKVVKVRMISLLNEDHFDKYEKWVYSTAKEKEWSNTTINIRLSLVSRVLNRVFKEFKLKQSDREHLKNARECCSFYYADKPDYDPEPISKEDYLNILNNTTDKIYKAVMLTALNCGMKETELADIRIKPRGKRKNLDINFKEKTLSKPRTKTGVIAVAVLWDRTIEAIEEMMAEYQNDSDFLFLNNAGNPIKPRNISKWWSRERKRAGVSDYIKFEHIRDASQTVPIDRDPKLLFETRLLMGHNIEGVTNNYLHRRPSMVKRTCEIIEDHYFGKEKST